jgi:hypothetical protein
VLNVVSDYEVEQWQQAGTGNKAEQFAAQNFLAALRKALKATTKKVASGSISL